MELRQIQHFLAVVEQGSLGKAAATLRITQAAVSKSIKRLEDELRVKLLDRSARGVRPTIFGQSFATHARHIAHEALNARYDIEALRGAKGGDLRVGTSPSIARQLLPRAVSRLLARRPGVRIQVFTGMVTDLFEKIRRGDLDLLVSALPSDVHDDDLVQSDLFTSPVKLVVGPHHRLVEVPDVQLRDLLDYDWIVPIGAASGRDQLEHSFRAVGLRVPVPKIETDSISFICAFLNESRFISLLPHELLTIEQRADRLRPIAVRGTNWCRPVSVVHRRRTTQPPIVKLLVNELKHLAAGGLTRSDM